MAVIQCSTRLQFDDQAFFNEQVCKIVAWHLTIFVQNGQRKLWLNLNSLLSQAMSHSFFIDLLKMTMSQIAMQSVSRFPHAITQRKNL